MYLGRLTWLFWCQATHTHTQGACWYPRCFPTLNLNFSSDSYHFLKILSYHYCHDYLLQLCQISCNLVKFYKTVFHYACKVNGKRFPSQKRLFLTSYCSLLLGSFTQSFFLSHTLNYSFIQSFLGDICFCKDLVVLKKTENFVFDGSGSLSSDTSG